MTRKQGLLLTTTLVLLTLAMIVGVLATENPYLVGPAMFLSIYAGVWIERWRYYRRGSGPRT